VGPGGEHLNREGVDTCLDLVIEGGHDGAVLGQAGLTGETIGGDADAKMRLATLAPARMTLMSVAVVNHFKVARGEFRRKFLNNGVSNGHMAKGSVFTRGTI
jgi:hypothetical protein